MVNTNLFEIQHNINYEFKNMELLYQAMAHSSYINDSKKILHIEKHSARINPLN